ncbi:MAG: M20/M25/M40 family metallo-hydrolase [Hyphomonadaceae bacterium]|nr:M20/M25/M40 family metallo-hydrolase [Hyphomonadaceae bacterium]
MTGLKAALSIVFAIGIAACTTTTSGYQPQHYSPQPAIDMLEALSADALQGRGVGTEGSAAARVMIIDRLEALGVSAVGESYEHPFKYGPFRNPQTGEDAVPDKDGINVIAMIPGMLTGGPSMVVTAHYDHLGVREGEIYNGTDDNASGVVGALALAEHFSNTPPQHDVYFVFFDAEEDGFGGARDFISNPPLPLETVALNLNFDMVSRGDNGILWASGTHHWPDMVARVDAVAATAPVSVERGYDTGDGRDDWTMLSDHAVFFRAGIPHIYFGVEDHPDYHRPSDDFENVDQEWFLKSVDTLAMMAEAMDADLGEILTMRRAANAD